MELARIALQVIGQSGWTWLMPLDLASPVVRVIWDEKKVPLPRLPARTLWKRAVGYTVDLGPGTYTFATKKAGLDYQRSIVRAVLDEDGVALPFDLCTRYDTAGTHTQIFRNCLLREWPRFDAPKVRWGKWSLEVESSDGKIYSTATSGDVPGSSPYELWVGSGSGADASFGTSGASGAEAVTATQTTMQVSGAGVLVPGDVYLVGTELVTVISVEGTTVIVERGGGGSIPQPHPTGEPWIILTDPVQTTEGATEMSMLIWPGRVEKIAAENAGLMQKVIRIVGGARTISAAQVSGCGSPGYADAGLDAETQIIISNKAWNEATGQRIAVTLGRTATESANATTGSVRVESGGTLYAWPASSAGHNDLQLTMNVK